MLVDRQKTIVEFVRVSPYSISANISTNACGYDFLQWRGALDIIA